MCCCRETPKTWPRGALRTGLEKTALIHWMNFMYWRAWAHKCIRKLLSEVIHQTRNSPGSPNLSVFYLSVPLTSPGPATLICAAVISSSSPGHVPAPPFVPHHNTIPAHYLQPGISEVSLSTCSFAFRPHFPEIHQWTYLCVVWVVLCRVCCLTLSWQLLCMEDIMTMIINIWI